MKCDLAGICSGCRWIHLDPDSQREDKLKELQEGLKAIGSHVQDIQYLRPSEKETRNRADLTIMSDENGACQIGLYSTEKDLRRLVDIPLCPQLEASLNVFLKEFREDIPIVKKGSLRLRVGLNGIKGVWIDYSNIDIKNLLEEGKWLDRNASFYIEIGQKKKRAVKEDKWKLSEGVPQPWSYTFIGDNLTPTPLYSFVSSFTQPGMSGNRSLVSQVLKLSSVIKPQNLLELGAGSGNFTLPLLSQGISVTAIEMDGSTENSFKLSLQSASQIDESILKARVEWRVGDFTRSRTKNEVLGKVKFDTLLVDPPRSGLGSFLDETPQVENIIYVSCFLKSFLEDSLKLKNSGFTLKSMSVVDQFPDTPHAEYVAHFSR